MAKTLAIIFSMPYAKSLIFKGGSSLQIIRGIIIAFVLLPMRKGYPRSNFVDFSVYWNLMDFL
jgi:hypothetical protein